MDVQGSTQLLDLETRLRRSKGRGSRECSINSKLTRKELTDIEERAHSQGKAVGEWAREVLLREARRSQDDPVLTEIVGTRILLNNVLRHLAVSSGMPLDEFTKLLESVRGNKRAVAREVMSQYTSEPREKE